MALPDWEAVNVVEPAPKIQTGEPVKTIEGFPEFVITNEFPAQEFALAPPMSIALFAPYTEEVNLKIIDQIGKVVYQSTEQGQFNNYMKTIPIGQFATGVYQIILKTNENQWVTKFVK